MTNEVVDVELIIVKVLIDRIPYPYRLLTPTTATKSPTLIEVLNDSLVLIITVDPEDVPVEKILFIGVSTISKVVTYTSLVNESTKSTTVVGLKI